MRTMPSRRNTITAWPEKDFRHFRHFKQITHFRDTIHFKLIKQFKHIKTFIMKKTILAATVLLLAAFSAGAQNRDDSRREPPKDPTEHIAKELGLDESATAKFSEIYKAYREDAKALHPKPTGDRKKPSELTEDQIEQMVMDEFDQSQKLLDLRKSYYPRFREVLQPSQIHKFYMMERRMGEHAMQRGGGPGGHRGGGRHPGRDRFQENGSN